MITQEELKKQLFYDPITGLFYWLERKSGRKKDKPAGCPRKNGGYLRRQITIDGKSYYSSRLAFLYMEDEPLKKSEIADHINGDTTNDCWNNLRKCNKSQNGRNQGKRVNTKTGFIGVSYHKRKRKYQAYIKTEDKLKFLGYYDNLEDAKQARLEAETKYWPNDGFNHRR